MTVSSLIELNVCKKKKKEKKSRSLEGLYFLPLSFCPSLSSLSLLTQMLTRHTWPCVSGVVVHQFVGSALFAAGNLHHHFNQQGSASSPKHSATIGKPRGQQHGPARAATSCRPDSRPHYHACLSVLLLVRRPVVLHSHSSCATVNTTLWEDTYLWFKTCMFSNDSHACVESDTSFIRV